MSRHFLCAHLGRRGGSRDFFFFKWNEGLPGGAGTGGRLKLDFYLFIFLHFSDLSSHINYTNHKKQHWTKRSSFKCQEPKNVRPGSQRVFFNCCCQVNLINMSLCKLFLMWLFFERQRWLANSRRFRVQYNLIPYSKVGLRQEKASVVKIKNQIHLPQW